MDLNNVLGLGMRLNKFILAFWVVYVAALPSLREFHKNVVIPGLEGDMGPYREFVEHYPEDNRKNALRFYYNKLRNHGYLKKITEEYWEKIEQIYSQNSKNPLVIFYAKCMVRLDQMDLKPEECFKYFHRYRYVGLNDGMPRG